MRKKKKKIIANLLYEYIDRTVQIKYHKYREIIITQCSVGLFNLERVDLPVMVVHQAGGDGWQCRQARSTCAVSVGGKTSAVQNGL